MTLSKNIQKLLLFSVLSAALSLPTQAQKKNAVGAAGTNKSAKTEYFVTGVVKEASTKKPLSAINVTIPGFSAGLTDDNGKFTIKVTSYQATLVISAEGFQTKEVALKGAKEVAINLLEEDAVSIYDNAELPFGTKPKSQTVQAVTSINQNGTWSRSNETPESFLQGRVAGMEVNMRSGTPNLGAYLMIRGANSLYTNNQPLIIVDGMIYDYQDNGASIISNHYTNALADIDVRDIENMTIIKDGVSTYGTKAANGVILITTNHAHKLATKIDFGMYSGVNYKPENLPVMGAADYRTYLSDVLKSKGMTDQQIQAHPAFNDNISNPSYYNYHNNTNWQDEVFKNSMSNNYFLKVSGGDNIAKYALTMGYMKNGGVLKNTDATKYNVRFNADLNLSPKLTASTNLTYSYYDQRLKNQGLAYKTNPILLALTKAPFLARNTYDANGLVSPNLADKDTFGVSNPAAIADNMLANSKVYRFFGSVNLKYQLTPSITLYTLGGITTDKVREQSFIPGMGVATDTLTNAIAINRSASQTKRIFSIYNETYANYAHTFNQIHKLNARAGVRFLNSTNEQDFALGYNSATDDFISVGTGATALRKVGGDMGKSAWFNSYVGADYGLLDKYFLALNVAADASSRFGKNIVDALTIGTHKYAVLPSLGASWLVSSENFMRELKQIDMLKVRASIAKTGNDDIGNYSAQQSYVAQNLLGVQGLVRANIANPYLQWESNLKTNLGIDLAVFNERLNFSVDFYQNKTTNMISYEPMPTASGFDYAITNGGSMNTNGMDFSMSARLINKQKLKWDIGLVIGTYKNRVTKLPGNQSIYNYGGATIISSVGYASNLFYGFKTNGVYATDGEAATAGLVKRQSDASYAPFKGGDIRFVDLNGDKIIDNNDRQVIGNATPDFTGGFTNKISWKSFTLDAVCTFSKGNQVYNGVRAALEASSNTNNQLQSVVNRWRAPGQITNVPKATYGDPMGNSSFSDRWIEDGSYFRVKSLSLNYDLPIKGKKSIKSLTVYATGNNLFTFTKYLGYDPEFYAAESILARGVDLGLEPQFKSMVFGIRMGL
jgi:TonB-linked SusC/RagA family outer membrane protein